MIYCVFDFSSASTHFGQFWRVPNSPKQPQTTRERLVVMFIYFFFELPYFQNKIIVMFLQPVQYNTQILEIPQTVSCTRGILELWDQLVVNKLFFLIMHSWMIDNYNYYICILGIRHRVANTIYNVIPFWQSRQIDPLSRRLLSRSAASRVCYVTCLRLIIYINCVKRSFAVILFTFVSLNYLHTEYIRSVA